jgi:hydroxycarboxylate dehydrogenase B
VPQIRSHQELTQIASALFEAAGSPPDEALLTAQNLVVTSLMGGDSHGVIRIPEYLDLIERGSITPGAEMTITAQSAATAVVDCGWNLGTVGATFAIREGITLARQHKVACVITRRCHHVGRLGAYPQIAAEEGLIALATCNSPIHGHFVLPWGGREGRLATNPIAYAVPTGGWPVFADFSTCVAPEGKIRWHRNLALPLPLGWILDAAGRPSTDPRDFYGPPRGGILPLGGAHGYKGFALGLLVEILGSALAGLSTTDPTLEGNGLCFIVIDPSCFVPLDRFRALMDDLVAYIKSSPPVDGVDEVLLPGDLELRTMRRRSESGIPLDDRTWRAIQEHRARLGVMIDQEQLA